MNAVARKLAKYILEFSQHVPPTPLDDLVSGLDHRKLINKKTTVNKVKNDKYKN